MPYELSQMTSAHLAQFPKERTVFFFPVGPLEDHGPHLRMSLDVDEAVLLSRLAAEQLEKEMPGWKGIIMPAVPLGIDSNTGYLAITVRPHVLRDWLVDACRGLIRNGFFHFVCFSGHLGPRQLTAIEDAGQIISRNWKNALLWRWIFKRSRRPTLISASSALVSGKMVLQSPFWTYAKEHGGKRDTSVALAMGGNLVQPVFKTLPNLSLNESPFWQLVQRKKQKLTGYWGEPAHADGIQGRDELQSALKTVFPRMKAVWEGTHPNRMFKTWFSLIPTNKSFFKAWLLAVLFVLAMVGWIYLNHFGIQIPEDGSAQVDN